MSSLTQAGSHGSDRAASAASVQSSRPFTAAQAEHRPEIDGLRAVAVGAVVLFHFGVPGLKGGFVGVDIFFVISGFLIGGILWKELALTGRLSLTNFLVRRIRRLAPAYVAMAIVVSVASSVILLPFELREFGKSLIASTFYLSNVYFASQSGYFDTDSSTKILLHTWSLSLEEQFYVFLPLLMLILSRWRRALLAAVAVACAGSLLANLLFTPIAHTAAFYLFPFRAWELLSGVLLAIYGHERAARWRHHAALSWLGLALILGSVAFVSDDRNFPGFQVIAPVLGTLLIILNGRHENPVNALLSSPPMVFLGLISYSLYLWHWPVVTLWSYYRGSEIGTADVAGWLALSLGLAWLSWRYVEQPFRQNSRLSRRSIAASMLAASASMLAIGGLIYRGDGFPERFGPAVRTHIEASADFIQDWSRCSVPSEGPFAGIRLCPLGPEGKPAFLVWGDSHARAFKDGLDRLAYDSNTPGLMIWRAGCPPLFGVQKQESSSSREEDEACSRANDRMLEAVSGTLDIDNVLLIGRWAYYEQGAGTGLDAHNTIALAKYPGALPGAQPQSQVYDDAVDETLGILSQRFKRVLVLRQVPEIPWYDSRDVARRLARGDAVADQEARFSIPLPAVAERGGAAEAPFLKAQRENKITWLDADSYFCSSQSCSAVREGQSMYFDNNHITNSTALRNRDLFLPLIGGPANQMSAKYAS